MNRYSIKRCNFNKEFLIKILMVTMPQSCCLVIFIKELLNVRLQKVFVVTHGGKSNACPLEGVCVVLQISGCVFATALDYRDKQQHLYVNQVVKLLSCTLPSLSYLNKFVCFSQFPNAISKQRLVNSSCFVLLPNVFIC